MAAIRLIPNITYQFCYYAALDPRKYGAYIDAAYHVTPSLQHTREAPGVFGLEHEAIAVLCDDLVVDIEYNPDVAE